MRLSRLQRHVLVMCVIRGGRSSRDPFYEFYRGTKRPPKRDDQVNAVTKTLERLIDREFLVGHGLRTPHKWYIREVRLTPKGKKIARELLGKQQSLPLKPFTVIARSRVTKSSKGGSDSGGQSE